MTSLFRKPSFVAGKSCLFSMTIWTHWCKLGIILIHSDSSILKKNQVTLPCSLLPWRHKSGELYRIFLNSFALEYELAILRDLKEMNIRFVACSFPFTVVWLHVWQYDPRGSNWWRGEMMDPIDPVCEMILHISCWTSLRHNTLMSVRYPAINHIFNMFIFHTLFSTCRTLVFFVQTKCNLFGCFF